MHLLGRSVHTVNENGEALAVASKETGLEINADKTKYIYGHVSRYQNAGRSHSMTTDNSSPEGVEEFKFWSSLNKSKF